MSDTPPVNETPNESESIDALESIHDTLPVRVDPSSDETPAVQNTQVVSDRPPLPRVPIVILAGGRASMDMEAATGVSNRALIKLSGKAMLLRVVEALRESEICGEITVVGKVPPSQYYERLPDKGDFVSNIISGAVVTGESPFMLICTCDLPFLTGEAVTDFLTAALQKAMESGASIIYPVVPVSRCYTRFPGLKRTALKLKEARLTGGNMMLTRPQFIISQRKRIADAYRARKSPLRLANMLGWDMIFRLLLSQTLMPRLLTLPLLEKRISQLLAGPARVFVSAYPEIATDVDKPSDYNAVVKIFQMLDAGGTLAELPEMVLGQEEKRASNRKKVRRPAKKRAAVKPSAQKGKPVARKRTP